MKRRIDHLQQGAIRNGLLQILGLLGLAAVGVGIGLVLPERPDATVADTAAIAEAPKPVEAAQPDSVTSPVIQASTSRPAAAVSAVAMVPPPPPAPPAPAPVEGQPGRQDPDRIIGNNDLDGDGVVTREEAARADKSLNKMWGLYDVDRDGRVDAEEIRKAYAEMDVGNALQKITGSSQGHIAVADPARIVANNDQDGDGIVTRAEAEKANTFLIGLFDNYDLNKDGKVDAREMAKASAY
jgi:Ca2+-binding EF-hand superfamily protein